VDFDGNPEPVAGHPCDAPIADIGCYEYQPQPGSVCDGGGMGDAGSDAGSGQDGGSAENAPLAVILPVTQTIDAGMAGTLDGSGSTASTGASLSAFNWTLLEGPTGLLLQDGPTQSLSFVTPGTYMFQLTVADTAGRTSAPATGTVMVLGSIPQPSIGTACGCGAAEAPWTLLVLAVGLLRTRRRAPCA
jgi:hypothetical protein